METRLTTICPVLDTLTKGLETDIITTIYGPSGSGKSNLCLIAAARIAAVKKAIFIDTEGGFSVERLKQLSEEYERLFDNMIVLKPTTFSEQRKAVQIVPTLIAEHRTVGIIIVDTISMLYRLELGTQEEIYEVNKSLGRQIGILSEIARKQHIPVLLTNQVYADFDNPGNINMVGGDLLKYGSKCLLELRRGRAGIRCAVIKKHRSVPEGRECSFRIVNEGIEILNTSEGSVFPPEDEHRESTENLVEDTPQ